MFHFLGNGVLPQRIVVLLVKLVCLLNRSRHRDPHLLLRTPIFGRSKLTDNSLALFQSMGHPPCKRRLFLQAIALHIISNLQGIALLEVLQVHPVLGVVFPTQQEFPTLRRAFGNPITVRLDIPSIAFIQSNSVIPFMVNNRI